MPAAVSAAERGGAGTAVAVDYRSSEGAATDAVAAIEDSSYSTGRVLGVPGGVMEAVCRGASEAGGRTIGILKRTDPTAGNEWVGTGIATGMGDARNALVVLNGAACIAVDGGAGTLSELGMAFVHDRPVAGLGTHDCSAFDGFRAVETPREAVEYVERAVA